MTLFKILVYFLLRYIAMVLSQTWVNKDHSLITAR